MLGSQQIYTTVILIKCSTSDYSYLEKKINCLPICVESRNIKDHSCYIIISIDVTKTLHDCSHACSRYDRGLGNG